MRAAVCPAYGPPEVVRIEEQPSPSVGQGQVRVRVAAAAVNFPDVLLIAGEYQISVPPPFVPGSEFAGEIVETGDDTEGFAVGDRVTGTGLYGAFADEVAVPATGLAHVPDGVDERTAAAFGVAYRTAYHTLRSMARIQPGDELIVLGAGGGVGLAAVQLGVLLGATVTAVASSSEKLDVAASYGALHLIDHQSATCAARSGRRCLAARMRSSTRSVANCPKPRCDRCGAAGASSLSDTHRASSPASRSTWCSSRAFTCSDSSFRTSHPTNSPATRTSCATTWSAAGCGRTSAPSTRLLKPQRR